MFNRQISEHFTLQQTANLTTDTLYAGAVEQLTQSTT